MEAMDVRYQCFPRFDWEELQGVDSAIKQLFIGLTGCVESHRL